MTESYLIDCLDVGGEDCMGRVFIGNYILVGLTSLSNERGNTCVIFYIKYSAKYCRQFRTFLHLETQLVDASYFDVYVWTWLHTTNKKKTWQPSNVYTRAQKLA